MKERLQRFRTRELEIDSLKIGGDNPIVIQTMATEQTLEVEKVSQQIIGLHIAGAQIIRVTAETIKQAEALKEIKSIVKKRYKDVPIVADVHHQGNAIALEALKYVDKIRINPGLFVYKKPIPGRVEYSSLEIEREQDEIKSCLTPVVLACRERGRLIRIGVNHGSLSDRLKVMYGNTAEGMVESAIEYLKICENIGYKDLVVSLKASDVSIMVKANKLMVNRMKKEEMDYPLHLGVTEAGGGQYARVKSSIGIGSLLAEGIGDTIRVSLSEDPKKEIEMGNDILQALGLKITKAEIIACPSCGRTKFDLPGVHEEVLEATKHLIGLKIAIMGCIVNGPGEMSEADYGYVGEGGEKITLYRGDRIVKRGISQERGVKELIELIKRDGRWIEPEKGDNLAASFDRKKVLNLRPIFS